MRIAFDLDGALIRSDIAFPLEESLSAFRDWISPREALRAGVRDLFVRLMQDEHEIWVYTSSYRDSAYTQRLFKRYGLGLSGVVNQPEHDKATGHFTDERRWVSKFPPLFGIDLLIEDSAGVALEGEKWGFAMLLLDGNDMEWAEKVLDRVREWTEDR